MVTLDIIVVEIDGINIPLKYIDKDKGYQLEPNTIDSHDSGRTAMDGTLHREIVAEKVKIYLSLAPVPALFTSQILTAIKKPFVSVTYLNPETNSLRTCNMAPSASRKCCLSLILKNGNIYYSGINFNLIEE